MGLFSWKTQDTGKSIPCKGSGRPFLNVIMLDNKGNKWWELKYQGYGVFGGKDFYELLAEMNSVGTDDPKVLRVTGINLAFSGKPILWPNLVESEDWVWRNEEPENCEFQGCFYDDDEEDSWGRDDWDVDENS
jgi:hypothetical protein